MRLLLIDIVYSTRDEIWPLVEHSLGLMYLASAVRERLGSAITTRIWTLVFLQVFTEDNRREILEVLDEFQPDTVGIRCLSIGKDSLHSLIPVIKEWDEDCVLVVGGPHATDNPEDVLRSGLVDCVVIGEGDITIQELMERRLRRQPFHDVPGIAFRSNGRFVRASPRALIADLDALPLPDYELVDFERFANRYMTFSFKFFKPHGNILTTRGCPYRCSYCHNILGKRFRARSPENVLAEIRFLHDRYGLTDFQIIDDIFNLDLDRAKAICDLIIESGMKLTLSFPNAVRGDLMDEELIDKMAEAGTKNLSYSVETASPRLQKLIQKNLDLDKVFEAIDYTNRIGIVTRGYFMLGFPTETVDEVHQTIEYARASSLCGAAFFAVVYFPGTELYKLAQSLGYFQDESYEVRRDYVDVAEGPYEFSVETLLELKLKAIREFAFTPGRLENALKILPSYYSTREIDTFLFSYILSGRVRLEDVPDENARMLMRRHFLIAERFSKKGEFYV